jgi:hypothetical protein
MFIEVLSRIAEATDDVFSQRKETGEVFLIVPYSNLIDYN